jgi:hypothetical protein
VYVVSSSKITCSDIISLVYIVHQMLPAARRHNFVLVIVLPIYFREVEGRTTMITSTLISSTVPRASERIRVFLISQFFHVVS